MQYLKCRAKLQLRSIYHKGFVSLVHLHMSLKFIVSRECPFAVTKWALFKYTLLLPCSINVSMLSVSWLLLLHTTYHWWTNKQL